MAQFICPKCKHMWEQPVESGPVPGFDGPTDKPLRKYPDFTCDHCGEQFKDCVCDPAECRDCAAEVYWVRTPNQKKMPLNQDGTCHFDTCPERQ